MSQDVRRSTPGARKTPGVAFGRSLQPSPEEWAVRNRELTNNLVELINSYSPSATGNALDVGCQWGVMLDNLAERTTPRWWGADPVVERHLSRKGFELVTGTADALPFADEAFDCLVLANVYEHIPPDRRDASLSEMRRVLVPGGVIVGQLPNPHFPIESHSKLPLMGYLPARAQSAYWRFSPSRRGAGFHSVTVSALSRRARAAGLDVVLVRKYTYPPEAAPDSIRWLVRALRRPMAVVPWSWQFVLRRPESDGSRASADANIYTGDASWFGVTDAQLDNAALNELLATYRAGKAPLPATLRKMLQAVDGESGVDSEVMERASELAARQPENYRGPEWQWMQEALVRLAAGGPLTMDDFRTRY